MKLPIIKHLTNFIEENDQDYVLEAIETLESITEVASLKDEELDVIGELISNLYGAIEVDKMIKEGVSKKEALKLNRYRKGIELLKLKQDTTLLFLRSLSDSMHVCRPKIGDGTLLTSIWNLDDGKIHLYFLQHHD